MPRCKPSGVICWPMLALMVASWSHAWEDAPTPPDSTQPSQKSLDYAAAVAFGKLLQTQSYTLPEDKVREVVFAWLRSDTSRPPKQMPAVEQLQGQMASNFEEVWTEMIKTATAGLDPDGKLDVAQRLRASLESSPWQNDAKAKHKDLLKKELPNALERVKGTLVQMQQEQLIATLRSVVCPNLPSQEQVRGAFQGDQTPTVNVLTSAVLDKLPTDLADVLILESFQGLSAAAENVVADGVNQLREQLQSLEEPPAAISSPAIEKALHNRLQELAAGQRASRVGEPLHPSYGVFLRASQEVAPKSRYWFDQQVSAGGQRVLEGVVSRTRSLPTEDEQTLRNRILADLPRHHRKTDSWRALQPEIAEMVKRGQQWIEEDLVQAWRQSKSPDDPSYLEAQLRQDVANITNTVGNRGYETWTQLQRVLRLRYEEDVLTAVRDRIADQQASQYAPQLMNKSWTPTESDLRNTPQPLQPAALDDLRVWISGPPRPRDDVLQETWDRWLRAAQDALAIAQQASDGQLRIVEELRPSIVERIRHDSARTHDKWVTQFCEQTTAEWRTRGATVAVRYPELFSTTVASIKQIVEEILPQLDPQQPGMLGAAPEATPESQQPDTTELDVPPTAVPAEIVPAAPQPMEPEPALPLDGIGDPSQRDSEDQPEDPNDLNGKGNQNELGGAADEGSGAGQGHGGADDTGQQGDAEPGQGPGQGGKADDGEQHDSGDAAQGNGAKWSNDRPMHQVPEPLTFAEWCYRIGFWVLLILVLAMAVCWYLHIRHYKRMLARYRRALPGDVVW